jgi:TolC family type I secretion outer membrane protein
MRRSHSLSRKGIAAAALASTALTLAPGPAGATQLADALVGAYQTNPQLQAERATLRATDELVPQALSGYRPRVFLNGAVQGTRGEIGNLKTSTSNRISGLVSGTGASGNGSQDGSQDANSTTRQVDLSLRQNLYAGGGTVASVRRAESQVLSERANLLATEQNVLLNAVDAYATAWQDRSVLELALNNEQRLRRELEATRDRFRVGEVARTDVAQAEASLSQSRADVETAKSDLATAVAVYRQVIGSDPGVLQQPRSVPDLPRTIQQAQDLAAGNPALTSAQYAVAAAREAVRVTYASLLPSVDLSSDLLYANQPSSEIPWERQASLGLSVTIPLYQQGLVSSQVRQSRQQVEATQNNLQTSQRSVTESVASAWEQLIAARAAIQSLRDAVRANEIALEGVRQEALVGARTVLDVLDAEQALFTSQVNLVRAQRVEVVTSYQLKSAVGQLTVADLRLATQPYDPEAYYRRNRDRLFGIDGGK